MGDFFGKLLMPSIKTGPRVTDAAAPPPQKPKAQELIEPAVDPAAEAAALQASILGTKQLEIPLYQPVNAP